MLQYFRQPNLFYTKRNTNRYKVSLKSFIVASVVLVLTLLLIISMLDKTDLTH